MNYSDEQKNIIKTNIWTYGGGFINKLWTAYEHADNQNKLKIETAFRDEFEKYLNFKN